jgi:nitronate monooxygenase
MRLPNIIQGGMGAGVSSWRLARAVSAAGQLGVVSGIALDVITARRLQDGDPDGDVRRAIDHFPLRRIAERVLERYFIAGGKKNEAPYATVPMHTPKPNRELDELCILGNFVEVFLAREGHDNPVGINYLEKIQLPHLPSIYGAMLAGVTFVLMGAGIPIKVPGVLDALTMHQPATYELTVSGSLPGDETLLKFDPATYNDVVTTPLERPRFFAIVSSNVLATTMLRRSNGRVDGLIVEGATAGGHNAPPRGKIQLDADGQPVYGEKDAVDLEKIRELGVPFWLAGGYGGAEQLKAAMAAGATGVQVGTAFAFCDESGLKPEYRSAILQQAREGTAHVFTDPVASPTGFPFKVVNVDGSLADQSAYEARPRVCDLGYLREAFRDADGATGMRCPAEPAAAFVAKGGAAERTAGRKCLCNALLANIGMAQVRRGSVEAPLVTAGDDLRNVSRFIRAGQTTYSARDVIEQLLAG